ncbi:MAG: glycine zipper 2TM domain-containing protein [Pseudomonadales bacterium]
MSGLTRVIANGFGLVSRKVVVCAALTALPLAALPGVASADSYAEARVVSASPVYRTVSYAVPVEQCHEEEVAYAEPAARRSATPVILGAIIGGALGNAVGHHKTNKRVGTAVGAVLGGSIGADIGRRQATAGGATRYRTERVCRTVDETREQEELAGYDVAYEYGGQVYHTQTRRDPGPTLRVRVHISPAE